MDEEELQPLDATLTRILAVALVAASLSLSIALATDNVTNLGAQSRALPPNPNFPLGGYRRYYKPLAPHSRAEVLLFRDFQELSNAETWPLVKALSQFGTWSNVQPIERQCPTGGPGSNICSISGLDLSRAVYRSRYVHFVLRQLMDQQGHCRNDVTPYEVRLLHHFSLRFGVARGSSIKCWYPANPGPQDPIPIVLIGGYAQSGIEIVNRGDFSSYPSQTTPTAIPGTSGLPFATILMDLQKGINPPYTTLNSDLGAEANVMTALICHTDKLQPRDVCQRSPIREILKHVK